MKKRLESVTMCIRDEITERLRFVHAEIAKQSDVASMYTAETLPFADEMAQIAEWLDVNEFGLAYESMVATLEVLPFVLSGSACVKLVEAALLMGYKTDRDEDQRFDRR